MTLWDPEQVGLHPWESGPSHPGMQRALPGPGTQDWHRVRPQAQVGCGGGRWGLCPMDQVSL